MLLSLFAMRTRDFFPLAKFERPEIWRGTREGLVYVLHQRRMLVVLGLTVVLSTFAFNFNVTLPVLAGQTLNTNAQVYGILSALFGAGALVGALAAASLGRASTRVLLLGSLVFTGSELLLAPVTTPWLAGLLLFVTGAGFTAWSANSNASMQLAAPDHLRGRIIGLYFYAFNGTGPLGGLLAGWLCAKGGTELAFAVAGVVGLAGTAVAAVQLRPKRGIRIPRQGAAAGRAGSRRVAGASFPGRRHLYLQAGRWAAARPALSFFSGVRSPEPRALSRRCRDRRLPHTGRALRGAPGLPVRAALARRRRAAHALRGRGRGRPGPAPPRRADVVVPLAEDHPAARGAAGA